MKKKVIPVLLLILILSVVYAEYSFGVLAFAGFDNKGLEVKQVTHRLANADTTSSVSVDHTVWDGLLKAHVDAKGVVNYGGFIQDKAKLEDYLEFLAARVPDDTWSVQEQLAYYINLYNAATVKLILDHYPVQSIQDVPRTWAVPFIKIGAKEFSLGALEHSLLRKMNEPRIHFAINCASKSCPDLWNSAYTAAHLDTQLDRATRRFLNSDKNHISEDRLELSKIFQWFKGDFNDGDLIGFLDPYVGFNISSSAEIEFRPYDWSLNGS